MNNNTDIFTLLAKIEKLHKSIDILVEEILDKTEENNQIYDNIEVILQGKINVELYKILNNIQKQ